MTARLIIARSFRSLAARKLVISNVNSVRMSSAYKPPATWYPQHYDELPVPQGSWKTANELLQRKRNLHFYGGILFFLFTLSVLKASGKFFFNFSPPPLPGEEDGECRVVKKTC